MADTLIIFIDSLRYDQATEMGFLGRMPELCSVRPGFGYSVNIHAELFAGYRPDEVGYFCEWMVNPNESPGRRWHRLLPLLDAIFRPYVLNRGLQRLLTRGYRPDHIMPNIPLRHLDKFAVAGEHILSSRFPKPTLFSKHPGLQVLPYRGIAPKGSRDEALSRRALAALAEQLCLKLSGRLAGTILSIFASLDMGRLFLMMPMMTRAQLLEKRISFC